MKRKQFAVLLVLTAILMGCGSVGTSEKNTDMAGAEADAEPEADAGLGSDADGSEDTKENGQEDGKEVSGTEGREHDSGQESVLPKGICYGQTVLEDEEAVYCCGMEQIRRIEKEDGKTRILWEKTADGEGSSFSMEGNGILLGDTLYFLEQGLGDEDGGYGRGLSAVRTDGSGYHRIAEPEDYPDSFYYYDGALYLEAYGALWRCPVTAGGSIPEGEKIKEVYLENLPEGYSTLNIWHGGNRYMGAFESFITFGCYLMENQDMETVAIDPETGKEKVLPVKGRLQAATSEHLLFSDYGEDGREELYLLDAHLLDTLFSGTDASGPSSGETEAFGGRLLTVYEKENYQSGMVVLAMDQNNVYIVAENPAGDPQEGSIYEAVSLETGEHRELFRIGRQLGLEGRYPFYIRRMTFRDGFVYYADSQDYKVYLMRRSLEDTEKAETIGDAFYDSGISQVGRVENYFERVYSETVPDFVLAEIDIERLVVDEKFEGAQEINRIFMEYQETVIDYEKNQEDIKWREEELEASLAEGMTPYSLSYSYSSYPSEIYYFDGDRFSFLQMDYDYTGGAHGMPYWEGFTFDLHTGKRLLLPDIIENSEEELKEIVVRYFDEYMSKTPDRFWEDALKTVEDSTGLSSRFYLTENGITFYFEPYALSSYSEGFQEVTVPYEEFKLKITPRSPSL